MSLLLHMSDTHFGTEEPAVVEALHRFIDERRPDVIVHSGDVTQRAAHREFRAARGFMDRHASSRWLVVPGNHDVPLWSPLTRLLRPYAAFQSGLGLAPETELDLADVLVVGVNTTRPWRHKHGEVSKRQILDVSARLRRARGAQLRIVVTHQPVHVVTARDRVNLLRGAERAVRSWSEAGADLFLGGHIHLPYVRPLDAEERGTSPRAWVVQAGTAISRRTRGACPHSVFSIQHDPGRNCVVERWDFQAPERGFVASERFELGLDRAGRDPRR